MKPLDPAEWDFRSVKVESVERALKYEYLRAHPPAKKFILAILEHNMPDWLEASVQISFRTVLLRKPDPNFGPMKEVVDNFMGAVEPFFIEHTFSQFPEPFLRIFPEGRVPKAAPIEPFQVWPIDARRLYRPRAFTLDETVTVAQCVQSFKKWLLDEGKHASGRGKKKRAPFAALRKLAALRLNEAGYSWSAASFLITKRIENHRMNDPMSVLPNYASSGRWDTSIKEARGEIEAELGSIPFSVL